MVVYNVKWSHEWELGMNNMEVIEILLDSGDADDLARARGMRYYLSTLLRTWLCGEPITVPASTSDVSQCL